jgi:phenylalanyl-tRNA synthetase beta chain
MKFTMSWLRQHLDTDVDLDAIVEGLTAVGLEVESVENPAEALAAFTVAEIVSAGPHPNADRLQVCEVNTGEETITVVCGAPNAREGIKVVLGRPGDYVPGIDVTLALRSVRGVESNGMLCSPAELKISDDQDGIIEVPQEAPLGASYVQAAGLDDPVIEIAITPNRQDCLGVHGIARDLAAAGLGVLKPLEVPQVPSHGPSPTRVSTRTDNCPLFIGRTFTGVQNGPSPQWLQERLRSIGLRPISTLVDITNYISYEFGRPLHVYDVAKLKGDLCAREALPGESFVALDDKTYVTAGGETVIADSESVLGFGGVIGGAESGCTDETVDVLLEVALFDTVSTAMTGRHHGILTDARYRFERGVDPLFAEPGMLIASAMILDLCGGQANEPVYGGTVPAWEKTVSFRPDRVRTLGGLDLDEAESLRILAALGFSIGEKTGDAYSVAVPSWRVDVVAEPDLVEEVLRIHGIDNVPSVELPSIDHRAGTTLSLSQKRARASKRALAAAGMMEAVTWSFMGRDTAAIFGGGGADLVIDNPISSDLDCMRPSILPNLLQAAQRNANRGAEGAALFEVGPVYLDDTLDGQLLVAAGVRTGKSGSRHWQEPQREVTVFDAKADALEALAAVGAPVDKLSVYGEAGDHYHPGRSGTLRLGPKNVLARFGQLHPTALKGLDVDGPAAGFEVFLDRVPARKKNATSKGAVKMSNLQAVVRDFAFVVDRDVSASALMRAVRGAEKKLISDVLVFDVYEGPGIEEGQKSVAISIRLEPQETTFSDADIEAVTQKVVQAAEKATGAVLR